MNIFERHNYKHESLEMDLVDDILANGNPQAIKAVLHCMMLEGVLHQIEDHKPPKGWKRIDWIEALAKWAISPDFRAKPPNGT